MKLEGFLGEEDFNHGDHVFLEDQENVYTVISVSATPKEGGELCITDWENPNGPYWEKAENCFKKESAPILPTY